VQWTHVVLPAPLGPISAVIWRPRRAEGEVVDGNDAAETHRQMIDGEDVIATHNVLA